MSTDVDHGQSADRTGGEFPVFDQIEKPAFFGHDRLRGREKREGPRLHDRINPRLELEVVELALRRHRSRGLADLGQITDRLGAGFAEIDHHGTDFLFRNRGSPDRHAFFGKPGADTLGDTLVVAAMKPGVLEQRGAGAAPLEVFAVAIGAEQRVALSDGAGAEILGVCRGASECSDRGEQRKQAAPCGRGEPNQGATLTACAGDVAQFLSECDHENVRADRMVRVGVPAFFGAPSWSRRAGSGGFFPPPEPAIGLRPAVVTAWSKSTE